MPRRDSFYSLFRLRNLSLQSLPVVWFSWELVFYSLPPPVHHGDSFAAKELLSPLLSPRIIFAHRIQSTAGRIWPLIERFDCCATVPCDSALICWQVDVPSKIQDFAEFGSGIHLFVKVPDSCTRIKDHLQAEGNECSRHLRWGAAVPTSQSKHFCHRQGAVPVKEQKPALGHYHINVTHLKLSSWL